MLVGLTTLSGASDAPVHAQARGFVIPLPVIPLPVRTHDIPADGILQTGHTEWLTALTFSPDGRKLFSAADDRTLRTWDVESGIQLYRLEHNGPVGALAVTSDGQRVISATRDGTLTVWRVGNGALEATFAHTSEIHAIAVDTPGARLATASSASVAIWDVGSTRRIWAIDPHMNGVTFVGFVPDGRSILVGSYDGDTEIRGTIKQFDAATGKLQRTRTEIIYGASNDGGVIAIQPRRSRVQLFETQTRTRLSTLPTSPRLEPPIPLGLSSTGRRVAYIEAGELVVRDSRGNPPTTRFKTSGHIVALNPPGTTIAVADGTTIRVWDVVNRRPLHKLSAQLGGTGALAFSSDGLFLATGGAGDADGAVKIWDLTTRREALPVLEQHEATIALAFSPHNQYLVAAGGRRPIRVIDVRTGIETKRLSIGSDFTTALAINSDGSKLASAGPVVRVWDMDTGQPIVTIPDRYAQILAFNPAGTLLACAPGSGSITIYDTKTGQAVRSLPPTSDRPSAMQFSPDGSRLAVGSRTPVRVSFGADPLRPVMQLVAADNAAIVTFDVNTGSASYRIAAGDWVSAVAFTPSGKSLVAALGSHDQPGVVKLWDAQSGRELRTLIERVSGDGAAAFSPALASFAAGSRDNTGTIRLWKMPATD